MHYNIVLMARPEWTMISLNWQHCAHNRIRKQCHDIIVLTEWFLGAAGYCTAFLLFQVLLHTMQQMYFNQIWWFIESEFECSVTLSNYNIKSSRYN